MLYSLTFGIFMILFSMIWTLTCFWACHVFGLHFTLSLSSPLLIISFGAFHLACVSFLFLALFFQDFFGWGGVQLHLRGSLGLGLVLDLVLTFDHLIDIHFGPSIGIFSFGTQLGPWMFFIWYGAFPDLFQGLVQHFISFLDLELNPTSSNSAIAYVSLCILDLCLRLLYNSCDISMHCIVSYCTLYTMH